MQNGRHWGVIYRVRMTAGKNFYLRLTVEKVHAFAVFMERYLRSYGCNNTNFTAAVSCTNSRNEIQTEIIKT